MCARKIVIAEIFVLVRGEMKAPFILFFSRLLSLKSGSNSRILLFFMCVEKQLHHVSKPSVQVKDGLQEVPLSSS